MAEQTLNFLVEGGKATAGPPIGPALGPLGVNIGKIISDINQKTADMKGITVPIKLIVNTETKAHTINVGTPPTSALIKKELNLQTGSGKTKLEPIADSPIDLIIKVAKVKKDTLRSSDMKAAVKEVLGTCKSMGVLVEGADAQEIQKAIDKGEHMDKITGKVALRAIPLSEIESKKKGLAAIIEAKRAEEAKKAAEAQAAEAAATPAEATATPTAEASATAKVTKEEVKSAVTKEKAKPIPANSKA